MNLCCRYGCTQSPSSFRTFIRYSNSIRRLRCGASEGTATTNDSGAGPVLFAIVVDDDDSKTAASTLNRLTNTQIKVHRGEAGHRKIRRVPTTRRVERADMKAQNEQKTKHFSIQRSNFLTRKFVIEMCFLMHLVSNQ